MCVFFSLEKNVLCFNVDWGSSPKYLLSISTFSEIKKVQFMFVLHDTSIWYTLSVYKSLWVATICIFEMLVNKSEGMGGLSLH